ncbi:hypothetical protein BY996DRAFT_6477855 [Phakopsora pachyrhizi]|nr:hypothetical protein BY996DRAFT_6477855 [Phakopsora pachyrhizi]
MRDFHDFESQSDLITSLPNVGIGTRPVDNAGQSLRVQESNNMIRIDERLDDLNLTTATTDLTRDFKLGIQRYNHLENLLTYIVIHFCNQEVGERKFTFDF